MIIGGIKVQKLSYNDTQHFFGDVGFIWYYAVHNMKGHQQRLFARKIF